MKQWTSFVLAIVVLSTMTTAGAHYPAPIGSSRDISRTSRSEYMVVIVGLPLKDWPKLQRFSGLDHFLKPQEICARAYSQFVAGRSGDKRLLAELARCRDSRPNRQWDTEDFRPVAAAIEKLFKQIGWM
jgi:hypothetical protein